MNPDRLKTGNYKMKFISRLLKSFAHFLTFLESRLAALQNKGKNVSRDLKPEHSYE